MQGHRPTPAGRDPSILLPQAESQGRDDRLLADPLPAQNPEKLQSKLDKLQKLNEVE